MEKVTTVIEKRFDLKRIAVPSTMGLDCLLQIENMAHTLWREVGYWQGNLIDQPKGSYWKVYSPNYRTWITESGEEMTGLSIVVSLLVRETVEEEPEPVTLHQFTGTELYEKWVNGTAGHDRWDSLAKYVNESGHETLHDLLGTCSHVVASIKSFIDSVPFAAPEILHSKAVDVLHPAQMELANMIKRFKEE